MGDSQPPTNAALFQKVKRVIAKLFPVISLEKLYPSPVTIFSG